MTCKNTPLFFGSLIVLMIFIISMILSFSENQKTSVVEVKIDQVKLGETLFNDVGLSINSKLSCASCHDPALYFQDGLDRGFSNNAFLRRNTPTLLNLSYYKEYFWDGKSKTLNDQMDGPLFSKAEMGSSEEHLDIFLRSSPKYKNLYIYSRSIEKDLSATLFVKKAIIEYLGTIQTKKTIWSQKNIHPVTDAAQRGYLVFNGRAGCSQCHSGKNFTDNKYHDNGLYRRKTTLQGIFEDGQLIRREAAHDIGRGDVENGLENMFNFRTPSLINAVKTAPYMHDGSLPTLESVIDFYDRGGDSKESKRKPLNLTKQEKRDLNEFLKSLVDVRQGKL